MWPLSFRNFLISSKLQPLNSAVTAALWPFTVARTLSMVQVRYATLVPFAFVRSALNVSPEGVIVTSTSPALELLSVTVEPLLSEKVLPSVVV